jgi:flavin reductase (DIM6/NTAB) family NADH-FMN oxidoreductase RutF
MSVDSLLFRRVVGSFASGVTIIVTGREGAYHGMTANAFTSLSLNPTLVLVCIDKRAATLGRVRETGGFSVNILDAAQEHLSRAFATRGSPESNGLIGVDFHLGESGLPVLDEAIATLECEVRQEYEGGDHAIFVAEVMHAQMADETEPLLFFRGGYHRIARPAAIG